MQAGPPESDTDETAQDPSERRVPLGGEPGADRIRIVALGGLGEIGMNCLAIEHREGIVVVDCGVTFPWNDLGIDVIHPRFDYLVEHADRVLGVVLTHGHEDHIGALPYLLDALEAPVFGPPHALELARQRLEEHGFDLAELDLVPTTPRVKFGLGPFEIEPVRVTHSIVEATALGIRTPAGLVVHTGDFKLDPTPPDGEPTDAERLRAFGDDGVRLLLSDSTGADSPGRAGSEKDVGEALGELVARARARVVIGMFSSNVQRLRMLGDVAQATRRRLCLLGRSVQGHVRAAERAGRLAWPSDLVVPPELAASMAKDRLLVIASGTQAERTSSLTRLAAGTHSAVRLEAGDLVVLSSRIIPGNDRAVFDMMGDFLRAGIELVTRIGDARVHASGHAHQGEQLAMIELTRPAAFVPVHGTLHHLVRHAELARTAGVADVLVAENGHVLELGREGPITRVGRAAVGRVATAHGRAIDPDVLRARAQLGRAGVAAVALVVGPRGELVAPPEVALSGVAPSSDAAFVRGARSAVAAAVGELDARARERDEELVAAARIAVRRFCEGKTGVRPSVVVTVTRT